MKLARIFILLHGWFFVFYGLYGAFMPSRMAALMGWVPDLLGQHQVRALWMVYAAIGVLILTASKRMSDQRPILLAVIFLLLAFASGRLLGLTLDGTGPVQTYYELGLELVLSVAGGLIYRRIK